MVKLLQYARNRIISLRAANTSIVKIVKVLQEDGIKTSSTSVSLFIAQHKWTGSVDDAQRSGRKPILSTMTGHHRQNAVLNSVLVNLEQHNRIWDNTTEFGAKEQNLRQQQNLGQHNGI